MKTKSIVLSVLLVCVCTALADQGNKADQRVRLARELYPFRLAHVAAVKQYEEDGVPSINYLTSIRQQNWAGSGMSKDEMKYYYREIEDEADPQPVGYVLLFTRTRCPVKPGMTKAPRRERFVQCGQWDNYRIIFEDFEAVYLFGIQIIDILKII